MEKTLRRRLYIIIFEANTPMGKFFDIALLVFIAISILAVMLESIGSVNDAYGQQLDVLEWALTSMFTIEYILRIYATRRPLRYIFSFYGIIDLLSLLPSYLTLFIAPEAGTENLMVIRALRLLRVFRILKFTRYTSESMVLMRAIAASRHKIFVFLFVVLNIIVIMGTLMYMVEGEAHGFTSIPHSIYWAIVTVTTVGYGDIAPQTDFGKFLASLSMLIGYAILAVPTGIVSHEISKHSQGSLNTRVCSNCFTEGHDDDALFCKHCGAEMDD